MNSFFMHPFMIDMPNLNYLNLEQSIYTITIIIIIKAIISMINIKATGISE